jgi:hypothetical protein
LKEKIEQFKSDAKKRKLEAMAAEMEKDLADDIPEDKMDMTP